MEKNYNITILLDIYNALLTARQQEVMEMYFSLDNSLAEIANILGISRQSVRDSIVSATESLKNLDSKLHLMEKFKGIYQAVEAELEFSKNAGNKESVARMTEILTILED